MFCGGARTGGQPFKRSPRFTLMVNNPFIPQTLIGRQAELDHISQIFTTDGDLMVAGVPGSGRRSLIHWAAKTVGARVLEIDCLRATHPSRFLEILAEGLLNVFSAPEELAQIQRWSIQHPLILEQASLRRARLVWHVPKSGEWTVFQALLTLPQVMAEWLNCRIVFVFQNFPHIRSWDRSGQWESYLRREIQQQDRINYVIVATVPETWADESNLEVMTLAPLQPEAIQTWIEAAMATEGFKFEPDALTLFLDYVQGHLADAIALSRRVWIEYLAVEPPPEQFSQPFLIQPHHVHRSLLALVEDLSSTFESLFLILPPIQARVLESLALDPTDSPQAREYIQKHQLSRGGGLQGALAGLEQKGLIYGAKYGYKLALPLFAFWLKHRMT
jgi:hypothetical protein